MSLESSVAGMAADDLDEGNDRAVRCGDLVSFAWDGLSFMSCKG
jgi:hypothetical protein